MLNGYCVTNLNSRLNPVRLAGSVNESIIDADASNDEIESIYASSVEGKLII